MMVSNPAETFYEAEALVKRAEELGLAILRGYPSVSIVTRCGPMWTYTNSLILECRSSHRLSEEDLQELQAGLSEFANSYPQERAVARQRHIHNRYWLEVAERRCAEDGRDTVKSLLSTWFPPPRDPQVEQKLSSLGLI